MNGQRLGIAGIGLIGGSIALRARCAGARVCGFDNDPVAGSRALERGAVDSLEHDLVALASRCDTLVIALPVAAAAAALEALVGRRGPGLIIDVASVKQPLQRYAGLVPNYIGTHPMAGRERGGIEAADRDLFEGATWAYMPHADRGLHRRVRTLIADMGALPLEIDAFAHDEIVALTSHLPQALSVALGAEVAHAIDSDPRVTELCGPGIRSMLRLARSPATLWGPIVAANAQPLARRLRSLARALVNAADGLERGDSTLLMSYFGVAHSTNVALEERFPPNSRS